MAGYQGDRTLEALELASDIWTKTAMAAKVEKMGYAADLHRMAHFSLPQIAKIVRINARFIYEEFTPNAKKGGRFDPQTLSTLARIRRAHLEGEKVPKQLIGMGIRGGTSYSCLTALTGISYSAYYEVSVQVNAQREQEGLKINRPPRRVLTDEDKAAKAEKDRLIAQKREFFEFRKQEIFNLRAEGMSMRDIGTVTDTDSGYVSKVLRGER